MNREGRANDDFLNVIMLLMVLAICMGLVSCDGDNPTCPEDDCEACYLIVLEDGTMVDASIVYRDEPMWVLINHCDETIRAERSVRSISRKETAECMDVVEVDE